RLVLVDRVVQLIDEGIDVAIRIGHLPDSSLVATRVAEVTRVACASPAYLASHRAPRAPADLARHDCIAFAAETWTFPAPRTGKPVQARVQPRLVVNTADAAIGSAIAGRGITRVLSYQAEDALRAGKLVKVLAAFEP